MVSEEKILEDFRENQRQIQEFLDKHNKEYIEHITEEHARLVEQAKELERLYGKPPIVEPKWEDWK